MVAARAAHGEACEENLCTTTAKLGTCAPSAAREREARWGELMCTSTLELPEAQALLDELVDSAVTSDANDQIRVADRQLSVGFRLGFVRHLSDSRRVAELVDQVDDPFVRVFVPERPCLGVVSRCLLRGALMEATRKLLTDAIELRVDPVLPYAHTQAGGRLRGPGEARRSERCGRAGRARLRVESTTRMALQNAYAIRVRNLLQKGAAAEACALEPPDLRSAIPSMQGRGA